MEHPSPPQIYLTNGLRQDQGRDSEAASIRHTRPAGHHLQVDASAGRDLLGGFDPLFEVVTVSDHLTSLAERVIG